jgi:glutamate racemase
LPRHDLIYYGDSAYCPYGLRDPAQIRSRSLTIARFLADRGAGPVVVACNTASIAALDYLRGLLAVPVVGMEPAVKPAAEGTRNGRIGVLATQVTLAGDRYNNLKEKFARQAEVVSVPCPGLVEMVEAGLTTGPAVEELLSECLSPMIGRKVDTIVLGSTHYHFLREAVQKVAGPDVLVIDTARAVACQTRRVTGDTVTPEEGRWAFFTSGQASGVQPVVRALLDDQELTVTEKPL